MLAQLGDAVFQLFESERVVLTASTAKKAHESIVLRVNAASQAEILALLDEHLTEPEKDLVRRARNMKASFRGGREQQAYRQATAFEALLGFLYLSDPERLKTLLRLTLQQNVKDRL